MNEWTTKEQDIHEATRIIMQYANDNQCTVLGLFELVINPKDKCMNLQLSSWVNKIAIHFYKLYGNDMGNLITRRVITYYIAAGQTFH